jgi:hypothetical protein
MKVALFHRYLILSNWFTTDRIKLLRIIVRTMEYERYTSISVPVSLRDEIKHRKEQFESKLGLRVTTVEYLRRVMKDWEVTQEEGGATRIYIEREEAFA